MRKVALIGAGAWGKNLAANLHALGALYAVAEPNPALRARMAELYPGVPVLDDYRPLLDTPVPAVAIATPAPTHFAIANESMLSGKDVFVEKPLTLAAAEADALVDLADSRGRVLMVGHLLMYQPAIRWMAEFLASGRLGRVVSLHQERLNLGRARAVENALWSFGVHDVAVLLHLVGRMPDRVMTTGQSAVTPGVEDDVHLHLAWEGGPHAHLHASWLWPEKRRRLTVVGTEGMLVYDELDQAVYWHHKGIGANLESRDAGVEVAFTGAEEPLRLELQHFLDRVKDRARPLSDGKSAADVVRVLERATGQLAPARRQEEANR
ncbi:putative oxidoreductase YhhX [compost metagenome]